MKKTIIFLIFTLVSLVFYPSCSSNDDNSSTPTSVKGKWNFSTMSTTINGVTSPETNYDGNVDGCSKDYLEFYSEGVYNEGDYDGSSCVLDVYHGTWSQTGNTITIVEGNEVYSAEIVSLSSSALKVKASETVNGVLITVNITFTKA